MKEINCNIIRDILPLYADDVVSQDTRELVEEHLAACEDCRRVLEASRASLPLPMDQDGKPLQEISRRWTIRSVLLILAAILCVPLGTELLYAVYRFLFETIPNILTNIFINLF